MIQLKIFLICSSNGLLAYRIFSGDLTGMLWAILISILFAIYVTEKDTKK